MDGLEANREEPSEDGDCRVYRLRFKALAVGLFLSLSPILLGFSPRGASAPSGRVGEGRHGRAMNDSKRARPASSRWALPDTSTLKLRSFSALAVDSWSHEVLYAQNTNTVTPIASITKLMTAVVVLDAGLPLDDPIRIDEPDVDSLKNSASRLPLGWVLPRGQVLNLALMSSDNRAAAALARTYPGGSSAFVNAMNAKAVSLGMENSRFADSSGLHPENVSTATDLVKLVRCAGRYDLMRQMTTADQLSFTSLSTGHTRFFGNSNGLIRDPRWRIGLSKTGFTSEAGHCLVMEAAILDRPVVMVFLDSFGKYSRIGDAQRLRRWLESGATPPAAARH
jgi:serine-type D-Ala-D-Ala endopeptidase (penicillin-binding protein 7)